MPSKLTLKIAYIIFKVYVWTGNVFVYIQNAQILWLIFLFLFCTLPNVALPPASSLPLMAAYASFAAAAWRGGYGRESAAPSASPAAWQSAGGRDLG